MITISQADRARLQTDLRRALHSPGLMLDPAETQGGTAQVRVGDSVRHGRPCGRRWRAVLGGDADRAGGGSDGIGEALLLRLVPRPALHALQACRSGNVLTFPDLVRPPL